MKKVMILFVSVFLVHMGVANSASDAGLLIWASPVGQLKLWGRPVPFAVKTEVLPRNKNYKIKVNAMLVNSSGEQVIEIRKTGPFYAGITPSLEIGENTLIVTAKIFDDQNCQEELCEMELSRLETTMYGQAPDGPLDPPDEGEIADPEEMDLPVGSGMQVEIEGVGDPGFYFTAIDEPIIVRSTNNIEFISEPRSTFVELNGETLDAATHYAFLSDSEFGIVGPWKEGKNILRMHTVDSEGDTFDEELEFWAGSREFVLDIQTVEKAPVEGADVQFILENGELILSRVTPSNGRVVIYNLPKVGVEIRASSSGFSLGNTHILDSEAENLALALQHTWYDVREVPPYEAGWLHHLSTWVNGNHGLSAWHVQLDPSKPLDCKAKNCAIEFAASEPLVSGVRSHKFKARRTGEISLRFSYIHRYFPSTIPLPNVGDLYSVAVIKNSGNVSNSSTISGQGWQTLNFSIVEGEAVEIQVTVKKSAYTADGGSVTYEPDPRIRIAPWGYGDFGISAVIFRHFEPQATDYMSSESLDYLSADSHNENVFAGKTRVRALVKAVGACGTDIDQIFLDVLDGISVISSAEGTIDTPFTLCQIGGNTAHATFDLAFPDSIGVQNKQYAFRVRALSSDNGRAERSLNVPRKVRSLIHLGKYLHPKRRTQGRDPDRRYGGDSWIRASIRPAIMYAMRKYSLTLNDASKMNGGTFDPHKQHKSGLDFDVANLKVFNLFDNLSDSMMREKSADTIIAIVKDPLLRPFIERIIVNYSGFVRDGGPQTDTFWQKIMSDNDVYYYVYASSGHANYFHIQFKDLY